MISVALGMATEVIIAQRVGRNEFAEADRQMRHSVKVAIWGTGLLALLWVALNQQMLGIYTDDPAILAFGFWVFVLAFVAEPARTVNIVMGSALRSTGDAAFISYSTIAVIWLFSVPLAYVLTITLGWGIYGVMSAALADESVRAAIKWWRWRKEHWKEYGVAAREAREAKRRNLMNQ